MLAQGVHRLGLQVVNFLRSADAVLLGLGQRLGQVGAHALAAGHHGHGRRQSLAGLGHAAELRQVGQGHGDRLGHVHQRAGH